jgi:hypothetical protein
MNVRKVLIPSAIAVTLITFVYLYVGLYGLATDYMHLPWLPAILYPFAIDAVVVVFLIAALDQHIKGAHYAFVWSVVATGSAVSALAQWIAHPATREAPLTPYLAAIPAAALVGLTHLLWVLVQDKIETVDSEQKSAERAKTLKPKARPRLDAQLTEVVALIEAADAEGVELNGREVATRLNLVDENGNINARKGAGLLRRARNL